VPAGFGASSLQSLTTAGFVIGFSEAVAGVAVDFSDAGADADMGNLLAFAGNSLLPPDVFTLPGNSTGDLTWGTLSVQGLGITRIEFGAAPDNSVFWDTLRVTVNRVPEPFTPALMMAGLGVLGFQRRVARQSAGG
jgi:hypothetical protein